MSRVKLFISCALNNQSNPIRNQDLPRVTLTAKKAKNIFEFLDSRDFNLFIVSRSSQIRISN